MDALLVILGTVPTIVAGACGIWWQVRRQRLAHSAALLISLEEQFRSEQLTEDRKKLALKIKDFPKCSKSEDLRGYWPVISFLDNLGVLVHRKAIDEELVWKRFNWRMTRCYLALKSGTNLLENTRTYYKDPSMYNEFEWLAKRMLKRYESERKSVEPTKAKEEYIEQEMALFPDEKPSGNQPPLPPKDEKRILSRGTIQGRTKPQGKRRR